MNCSGNRVLISELARDARPEVARYLALKAHLRHCLQCQGEFEAQVRLREAMASLAAEPAYPVDAEAALLAEFDRTYTRVTPRRLSRRVWYAGLAIAASLLLAWGVRQAGVPRPETPRAATPAVAKSLVAAKMVASNLVAPNLVAPGQTIPAPSLRPVRRRHQVVAVSAPEPEEPFVTIPYTAPLGPGERADIVQMDLPVSALIAAGFPIRVADPGARARADLVVGEDGRARAVRLISISTGAFQ